MFLALIIIVACVTYLMMAGVVGIRFYHWRTQLCSNCRPGYDCYNDHDVAACLAGAAWPVILPVLVGVYGGERPQRLQKKVAKLQKDIARLERENNIS